jgi:hypothetical protein
VHGPPAELAAFLLRCLNPERFLRVPDQRRRDQPGTSPPLARSISAAHAVIFAGPIAVIIFVAVNKLHVRFGLHEKTVLPGEDVD